MIEILGRYINCCEAHRNENSDVKDLLDSAELNIKQIKLDYSSRKINLIFIKSTLENLRSALDYSAQSISEKIRELTGGKAAKRTYFPYGKDVSNFERSINGYLPGLRGIIPKIYTIIEAQQSYVLNDKWLLDLCRLTNDVKHKKLTNSQSEGMLDVNIPGFLHGKASQGSAVIIFGNTLGGSRLDDVFINPDCSWTIVEIQKLHR